MPLCASPRPRNANATRQAILDAARDCFCAQSYDDVGMRDIARIVGVDAALISRYYGSKEDLFMAVLDSCKNGRELWEGLRNDFGRRLAREVILGESQCPQDEGADQSQRLGGLLILLRSIGSTKAMDVVQRTSNERFFGPLTEWLGGSNAAVRARLLAGVIMGMTISRELSEDFNGVNAEEREALADRMGLMLQALVDS